MEGVYYYNRGQGANLILVEMSVFLAGWFDV